MKYDSDKFDFSVYSTISGVDTLGPYYFFLNSAVLFTSFVLHVLKIQTIPILCTEYYEKLNRNV